MSCNATGSNTNIAESSYELGWASGFMGIGKGFSNGLVGKIPDSVFQDLIGGSEGSGKKADVSQVVKDAILAQTGPIVLLALGVLLIIGSHVFGCVTLCCRCCGNCGAKSSHGKTKLFVTSPLLLVSFLFILVGLICFNASASSTIEAIDELPENVEVLFDNVKSALHIDTNQITCKIEDFIDTTTADMEKFPNELFDHFNRSTGGKEFRETSFKGLSKRATDLASRAGTINDCSAASSSLAKTATQLGLLSKALETVAVHKPRIDNNVDQAVIDGRKKADKAIANAKDQLSKQREEIKDRMKSVDEKIGSIVGNIDAAKDTAVEQTKTVKQHVTANGWAVHLSGSLSGALALVFILIALVAAILVIIQKTEPEKKSSPLRIAVVVGFFVTIFTCWLVLLLFVIFYAPAIGLSLVCQPVFEDPTFRVLSFVKNVTLQNVNGENVVLRAQDIMKDCSTDKSPFDVFFKPEDIQKKLNMGDYRTKLADAIANVNQNFDIDQGMVTALVSATNLFDENHNELNGNAKQCPSNTKLNEFVADLDAYTKEVNEASDLMQRLYELKDNSKIREELRNITSVKVDKLESDVITKVTGLVDYSCKPMYTVFKNVGHLICDRVASPIHGMWFAAFLSGVFIVIASILLLCTSCSLAGSNKAGSPTSKAGNSLGSNAPPTPSSAAPPTPSSVASPHQSSLPEEPAAKPTPGSGESTK